MKTIIVTGGAGFIGSHFIRYILDKYPNYKIINVDALTYAGNLENLSGIYDNSRYTFIKGNITNRQKVQEIFTAHAVDSVVNFAAESHVDRSITDPQIFMKTNIIGVHTLLDIAKSFWKVHPEDKYCNNYKQGVKFIQISSDEVYGTLAEGGMFVESMPLMPNSPYSASKASADMIVRAYHETFNMPINITRCGNNYGPYQFPEKLIPLTIHNCLQSKNIPIYGDGLQIRDWIHVSDHCHAIDTVLHKGDCGEVYNIGGNNEVTNIEIVKMIIKELGKSNKLIQYIKDRPGHDRRYAIDNTKITSKFGWKPNYDFQQGIKETIRWYLNNLDWMERITSSNYRTYYNNMYLESNNQ